MPDAYLRFIVGSTGNAQIPGADVIASGSTMKPVTIPILSFDLGSEIAAGSAIAAETDPGDPARTEFHSLTVSVSPHVLTSPLADSVRHGKPLESLALIAEKPGTAGSPAVFDQYDFSMASVRSISWSEPTADAQLSEILTFEYAAVKVSELQQRPAVFEGTSAAGEVSNTSA